MYRLSHHFYIHIRVTEYPTPQYFLRKTKNNQVYIQANIAYIMSSSPISEFERDPRMEVADPKGDVVLLVGTEDQVFIRASSKILSMASPVIAAMLEPSFLEGGDPSDGVKVLYKLPSFQDYQLHLSEDDAEAFVWFCLVLHYQRKIDDYISLSLFEKLAWLCNKYDCAAALSPWSKIWLQRAFALPKDQAHCERLLYTSYVF